MAPLAALAVMLPTFAGQSLKWVEWHSIPHDDRAWLLFSALGTVVACPGWGAIAGAGGAWWVSGGRSTIRGQVTTLDRWIPLVASIAPPALILWRSRRGGLYQGEAFAYGWLSLLASPVALVLLAIRAFLAPPPVSRPGPAGRPREPDGAADA